MSINLFKNFEILVSSTFTPHAIFTYQHTTHQKPQDTAQERPQVQQNNFKTLPVKPEHVKQKVEFNKEAWRRQDLNWKIKKQTLTGDGTANGEEAEKEDDNKNNQWGRTDSDDTLCSGWVSAAVDQRWWRAAQGSWRQSKKGKNQFRFLE